MSEDTTTAPASETPNGAAPTGETPTTTETSETLGTDTTSLSPEGLTKELERLKNSLKRANAEAKANREAAEELNRRKASELSETERLQKELDELRSAREQETEERFVHTVRQEAAVEAAKLGVDPAYLDKVFRFLEWDEIEADESGKPANVRELIAQLVKEMPSLRGKSAPVTSGGATNPPRSQSTAPVQLSWDVIGSMKPDEYAARRAEIQEWIAKNPHRYGSRMK